MTRNEIENRIKIIRDLAPATTVGEHLHNQHEIEQFATAMAQWAEELTTRFEGFEMAQAVHETDPDMEVYKLFLVKDEVEAIATLFGF